MDPEDNTSLLVPDWAELIAARARIGAGVRRTPVVEARELAAASGAARVSLKCENLQWTGSFKVRGALNAVRSLAENKASRGVITHSSGNHGAALAWAAAQRGIQAWVVMPEDASPMKIEAVRSYGGQIEFCGVAPGDRERVAADLGAETGAVLVHPYDDRRIVCGQATAALELLEDTAGLDALITPIGGGGLVSGTIAAARGPDGEGRVDVFGVEPALADDAYRSWKESRRVPAASSATIADGLRARIGELNFAIVQEGIAAVLRVEEEAIVEAMKLLFRWCKLVVEPSGAVGVAALLEHRDAFAGRQAGIILSGGNIELERFCELTCGGRGLGP